MPAESPRDPSTPVLQEAWEELRAACFTSYGEGFVWAAGCPAEYYVLALHLAGSPGFRCDLSDNALVLIAFGARHVIPLAQLSPLSLQHLHVGVVGEQVVASSCTSDISSTQYRRTLAVQSSFTNATKHYVGAKA